MDYSMTLYEFEQGRMTSPGRIIRIIRPWFEYELSE
jgi:hypothetical protein